jgi:hypothetical protein
MMERNATQRNATQRNATQRNATQKKPLLLVDKEEGDFCNTQPVS